MKRLCCSLVFVLIARANGDAQQPPRLFEVGGQVGVAYSGQFNTSEGGLGARISWLPVESVGLESEINFYPHEFPGGVTFSRSRVEALFGATAGPRLRSVRPFARFRGGVMHYSEKPVVCLAIYPPPLSCLMAAGGNRPVLDLGGGLEAFIGARTFVRMDAGDRMVKYPGPSFVNGLMDRRDAFFGHDLRLAFGAGWRF
jgi:hypothetical protein